MALHVDDPRLAEGIGADWWERFEPPPGRRAEIIRGELVLSPSPGVPHAIAATRLTHMLEEFIPAHLIVVQNLEWRLVEKGCVAQAPIPDLSVIPLSGEDAFPQPLLAVEILSPSDWARR